MLKEIADHFDKMATAYYTEARLSERKTNKTIKTAKGDAYSHAAKIVREWQETPVAVETTNSRTDPWLFECKGSKNTLHHWIKAADGTSECMICKTRQTVEQTKRCFTDY